MRLVVELLQYAYNKAIKHGAKYHTNISEVAGEVEVSMKKFGYTPVEYLEK